MADPLGTLATAIITNRKEVPRETAVAITAASTFMSPPMAVAAAILAVENGKDREGVTTDVTVGEEMVQLPSFLGKSRDYASKTLGGMKLGAEVELHSSSAEKKDLVFKQVPGPDEWVSVGSAVKLSVHNGPVPKGEVTLTEMVSGLREEVAELKFALNEVTEAAKVAAEVMKKTAAQSALKVGTGTGTGAGTGTGSGTEAAADPKKSGT